jgi:signal transduction histidine kinase
MMHYLATYLIYFAVLARAAGWSYDSGPFPIIIWLLLAVFGILLGTEQVITRKADWYPRLYTIFQASLVIAMLYITPKVDFFTMLFLPLSFQVVKFFNRRIGFMLIGIFSLAMAGMFYFGLESESGLTMIISSTGVNLLMGSLAHLITKTDQARIKNHQLFTELKETYRRLKHSSTQAEALAVAEERHHLVREMHDSLTQTLFSMNLASQAAQLLANEDPLKVLDHLNHLHDLVRTAVSEVQVLTGQIPYKTQPPESFESTLRQLVEKRCQQDGLEVDLEIEGNRQLTAFVQTHLYGIIQEALNNVSRHAGVYKAAIQLGLVEPQAWLEVEDNGCGFELKNPQTISGYGLVGMQDRANEIGWLLDISSQPEKGTRIRVTEGGK